jgi:hypothetical protein
MGTPAYMSPEQAEGHEIGPSSDVFSLGSVIAFAAMGVAPFDGGDMFSIAYRVVHAEPGLGRLSPALRALVAACLAKEPAARPSLERLMDSVVAGSAPFPPAAPGKFWPDPVDALVAGQASPAPVPGPGAGTAPGAGDGQALGVTHTVRPAATPVSPPAGPYPGPVTVPPRRGPGRWLLAAAGAGVAAAAVGATLALVLGSKGTDSTHLDGHTTPPSHSAPPATRSSTAAPASSSPSTAASASASPTASLIAVTVCTDPAVGCNVPGASQYMGIRPKEIYVSADGSGYVKNLVWTNWGSSQATATGTLEVDNCTPNCAQGQYAGYPATVTVSGLTPYGSGLEAYSTILVQAPTDPNNGTFAYTRDTVP